MKDAAAEQEFERAALMRNRLRAVRSLLERQRVTNEAVGTLDAIAVAAEGPDANAQVFQVRDGVLADRQSFYLENEAERDEDEVLEEFVLQYYASALSIPPQVIVAQAAPSAPRCWPRRWPSAAAARSRCVPPSAATSAASSSWPTATRGWRSTRTGCAPSAPAPARIEALDGLQQALGDGEHPDADRVLRHLEPGRDPHGRLDGRVRGRRAEEVRLPPLQDPRRGAGRLRRDGRGARPPDVAVRRAEGAVAAREGLRRELRRAAGADRDRRRQGPALRGPGGAGRVPGRGRDGDQPRQAARGGVRARPPGAAAAQARQRRRCSCSSACATRRTGSRSTSTAAAATGR